MNVVRVIKNKILDCLHRHNRWLCYFPDGVPTGVDLKHDLRLIVKGESPMVFDVGANIGQSIELFVDAFPTCRVHAFEPTPYCVRELKSRGFGERVKIHQTVLSDCEESRTFHFYEESVFNSVLQLHQGTENRFSYIQPVATEVCSTRTLDGMIEELETHAIDLLKIDTQGFDLHVLRGGERSFQRGLVRAVMVELNFIKMYEGQDDCLEIISFLKSHQLKLVDFYEKWRNGKPLAWCTALFSR